MNSTKIKNRISTIESELSAIDARSGEHLTHDDTIRADALTAELKNLEQIASEPQPRQTQPSALEGITTVRGIPRQLSCFSSERRALDFGKWVLGISGHAEYRAGMLSGDNQTGGYLVPDEFSRDLIRLVEERGVFRREARVATMSSDTLKIPRQISGATAFFVGEADAISESDLTLDQITLVLKKLGCLTSFSAELSSDSLIPVADMLGTDFSYRLADKEDQCGFSGTGTSTYGGITGVRQKLIDDALGGVAAGAVGSSGLVRYGTGHSYANIGLGHCNEAIGKLPQYAEANAKWYMSKFVWSYLLDLAVDAGGNSLEQLQAGPKGRYFLGYPVVISQVMPKASAVNQVCILLGDLRQAASMGIDRTGLRVQASDSAVLAGTSMFETDQIAIRGIERFDIVAHDCGSTTVPGPIVGIISHTA